VVDPLMHEYRAEQLTNLSKNDRGLS